DWGPGGNVWHGAPGPGIRQPHIGTAARAGARESTAEVEHAAVLSTAGSPMIYPAVTHRRMLFWLAGLAGALVYGSVCAAPTPTDAKASAPSPRTQKRWLFVWRNMSDPNEVDRM